MPVTPRQIPVAAMPDPYIQELARTDFPGGFGFAIGGSTAGPNILIAGRTAMTGQVFQRLLLLPTLSRMRGTLFLVHLDKFSSDDALSTLLGGISDGIIVDEQMFLPFVNVDHMSDEMEEDAIKEAYWAILRLCASKGMISGRGVPEKTSATDMPVVWRSSRVLTRQP